MTRNSKRMNYKRDTKRSCPSHSSRQQQLKNNPYWKATHNTNFRSQSFDRLNKSFYNRSQDWISHETFSLTWSIRFEILLHRIRFKKKKKERLSFSYRYPNRDNSSRKLRAKTFLKKFLRSLLSWQQIRETKIFTMLLRFNAT